VAHSLPAETGGLLRAGGGAVVIGQAGGAGPPAEPSAGVGAAKTGCGLGAAQREMRRPHGARPERTCSSRGEVVQFAPNMNPYKVVITDHSFPDVAVERELIEAAGGLLEVAQCRSEADVIAACRDADALLVQWAPVTERVLQGLERCKAVIRYGIGFDNVDLAAARRLGVAVANVPDYCIDEVADHTVALAVSLARQLFATQRRLREGTWKITPPAPMPAFRDMTFVVVGLGRIGRAVLGRAQGFGFRLAAHDPAPADEVFRGAGARRLSLDEAFAEADILSLHLPMSAGTRHLVSTDRLRAMKRTALLVNTSRGGLVDTRGLAVALAEGTIAGAGLDVFEEEPIPQSHPLLLCPNTILTSHVAWYSEGSLQRLQRLAAEEAARCVRGQSLRNRVNP
jgi:D-3-phosphoglycerate dehydrogenase